MDSTKLQDLILATEDMDKWDLNDPNKIQQLMRIAPKLLAALKEIALEVKCEECSGRGYLTGTTAFANHARGKCSKCRGLGSKYYFLELEV